MKIVVLDGYTLNPGDLDWSGLKELGDVEIYDRTPPDMILERATNADIILTNKVLITKEIIDELDSLKYIGVLATGYNNVDLKEANLKGIVVTNIPAYSTMSVAQMAFAHILNITNQVELHSELVRSGKWVESKDFCFTATTQRELSSYTIGVIGLGHTGMATANIALAFDMRVKAFSTKKNVKEGIDVVSLDELFKTCDIISLHCPLTTGTEHIINANNILKMKDGVIIINTGRGPLVNEHDLAEALNSGKVSAAGVDVLSCEPPKSDNPLLSAKNCYITPHIAWATLEARKRLMDIAIGNIKGFISGNIVNQVTV